MQFDFQNSETLNTTHHKLEFARQIKQNLIDLYTHVWLGSKHVINDATCCCPTQAVCTQIDSYQLM